MAIALDATGSGSGAGSSTLTYSHICTGSNLILIVGVGIESASDLVTGVTYNSVAMTLVDKLENLNADEWTYTFILVAPTTGTHNVVVSTSSNVTMASVSISYAGAKQSAQPDAHVSNATAGNNTKAITTVADNCWVIGFAQGDANLPAASTGVTSRKTVSQVNMGDSNGVVHPAGSYSMTYTVSAADCNLLMISISPAAVSTFKPNVLPLMGIG